MNYGKTQERIALCRNYETKLAESLRKAYRGIRLNLESQLDETKAEAREESEEKYWN